MIKIIRGTINKKGMLTTPMPYGIDNTKISATKNVITSLYFIVFSPNPKRHL